MFAKLDQYFLMIFIDIMSYHCVLQGEHIVKEIFPKKVAELNALLEVWHCQSVIA